MKNLTAKQKILRMRNAVGAETDIELARALGYSSTGTISRWKSSGNVPREAIEKVADLSGLSYAELTSGTGAEPRPSRPTINIGRLAHMRTMAKKAASDISKALGFDYVSVESGAREPDGEEVTELARLLKVSRGYLYGTTDDPTPTCKDMVGCGEFALIPLYNVAASAGGGALIVDEAIVDRLAFKDEWIRHTLHVDPKHLALISAVGDSMEPTLHPGDIIMMDCSVNAITNNAIYVIQVNGTLMVKRVQRMMDGRVIIRSDNAVYEVETLSSDMLEGLRIVGRVVWAGRQF